MDDQNYKDLARKARNLYGQMQNMQKIILIMSFDEFIDLDEEEQRLRTKEDKLSF